MLSCSVLLLSRLPTEFDVATDVETPLEIARSDDAPVDAHDNQTYVVRLRFAGSGGGWHWDETLRVEAGRPAAGYHGHHAFERAGVVLAPGENVTVSVVQADWLGVTLGDWRALHAVLWELELCGVPRSPNENVSYTDAPTGDLAAHYGWAVDAFGNLLGVS